MRKRHKQLYYMIAKTLRLDLETYNIINSFYGDNFSDKLRNYVRESQNWKRTLDYINKKNAKVIYK